jgi:hypothetical protein
MIEMSDVDRRDLLEHMHNGCSHPITIDPDRAAVTTAHAL